MPEAKASAPAPCGPPSLCADRARVSAPRAVRSTGIFPAAWTASTCSRPPAPCSRAAASATGWITPVSLLASIRAAATRSPRRSRAASQARSATPSAVTGQTSTGTDPARAVCITASCSMALTSRASMPTDRAARPSALASVPPPVKTSRSVAAPMRAASSARARSMPFRALRPAPCTDEGLPGASSTASMAARACGRRGAVAFQSR